MIYPNQGSGGISTETDPIYTADKPNIALKSEVTPIKTTVQLNTPFNVDYTTIYSEITTVSGLITQVDYWATSAKATKLFTKNITYSGSNPTVITMKDEVNNKTLTTTLGYTGSNISSVTKAVT